MTVTNIQTLDILADIAQLTYSEVTTPTAVGDYEELQVSIGGNLVIPTIDGPLGFQARAYFNDITDDLVIAFTGTEGFDEADLPELVPDLVADLGLAVAGISPQDAAAQAFIDAAEAAAQTKVGLFGDYDVTYVGHSLGGFLAQTASASGTEGEVVVFNSPGAGGFLGFPDNHPFPEQNFTYVYSNPDEWGLLGGAIHSIGTPLSDNLYYVSGSSGHALTTDDDTGLGDQLGTGGTLEVMDESEFLPIDGALQILSAAFLLDFFDDGSGSGSGLDGTPNDDIITGTADADVIDGLAGNDTIDGGNGADDISGGDGDDTIFGKAGHDMLKGGDGDDTLIGGNGFDVIIGGAGWDIIAGGIGNDMIISGSGNDRIWGGNRGGDSSTSDSQRDVFAFKEIGGNGFDIIWDFEDGIDKLDFSDLGYNDFSDISFVQNGDDLEFTLLGGGLLRISDFTAAEFTANDVLL